MGKKKGKQAITEQQALELMRDAYLPVLEREQAVLKLLEEIRQIDQAAYLRFMLLISRGYLKTEAQKAILEPTSLRRV